MKLFKILFAILCLICLLDNSYEFYEIFRYVALGSFIFLAVKDKDKHGWMAVWITSALLVQPFLRPDIDQETWHIIDIAWALLLTISLVTTDSLELNKSISNKAIKKFFAREFLILLLGAAIVVIASLYEDNERNKIFKYNSDLNVQLKKEIDSVKSLKKGTLDITKEFGYNVYKTLNDKRYLADKENRERIEDIDYYRYKKSPHQWVLNPAKDETFNTFIDKFSKKTPVYYRGFGTRPYPEHVYNAMSHWDSKYKSMHSFRQFVFLVEQTTVELKKINDKNRKFNLENDSKIKDLELKLKPFKTNIYRGYYVDDVITITLILLFGLRLFIYLIISSIKVLKK